MAKPEGDQGGLNHNLATADRLHRPSVSQSKSVCETVNGSHRYTVKGYSLVKGMGFGKYITSDTFSVGGYQWAVYFYPDGKNPEDNSLYVSVFIALASEGTDVRALFELTLLDQSAFVSIGSWSNNRGSMPFYPVRNMSRHIWCGRFGMIFFDFLVTDAHRGYKRFYRRTALETSDYLKDDCLVMNCTVGVVRNRIETSRQFSIPVPPPDMGKCLKELLESGMGSDIVFEVGDETFKAHKQILAARSPVFNAQFFGLIGDPKMDRVVVQDVEPPAFKAMLLFLYSDEFPDVHELTGSVSLCTSTILVQHLLAAADRYGLDRLRRLCESKLCEELTADTVAATLALAEQHQCSHLKSVCLKFTAARENLGVVMQTEGFNYLEETCPSLLSDLLATVAEADDDPSPICRKRSSSSNIGLNITDSVDLNGGRRTRRRIKLARTFYECKKDEIIDVDKSKDDVVITAQGSTDDELNPGCPSSILGVWWVYGTLSARLLLVCIFFFGNHFGQLGTGSDQAERLRAEAITLQHFVSDITVVTAGGVAAVSIAAAAAASTGQPVDTAGAILTITKILGTLPKPK
ncbi:putative BTB/POZ and MATH domain-containing protein 3 [Cocos nucifera]|uniref:Putative BTB/POZ and MATH domain-containing protein 3 n=1 Tax=Cocos nucifera TaxID=13894 RepID=A0A8K0IYW6_COCNU|nr:putative BTB/POZ and MATH domain-containing protein 3 [Cocos nucifera]